MGKELSCSNIQSRWNAMAYKTFGCIRTKGQEVIQGYIALA